MAEAGPVPGVHAATCIEFHLRHREVIRNRLTYWLIIAKLLACAVVNFLVMSETTSRHGLSQSKEGVEAGQDAIDKNCLEREKFSGTEAA